MTYEIPSLPYKYSDLEPYFDEATMRVHHTGHHQTYADKLNAALERYPELADQDLLTLIHHPEKLPEDIRLTVVNNGGGFINHSLWWDSLTRPAGEMNLPEGTTIGVEIDDQLNGYDGFVDAFRAEALALFGAGWTWLVLNKEGKLTLINTANQNLPPLEFTPLLGLDMWEHAYYLKHQNKKDAYIKDFFHVINWKKVDERLAAARAKNADA